LACLSNHASHPWLACPITHDPGDRMPVAGAAIAASAASVVTIRP
jgi:hypothetical protein